jgi:chorismate-pyruvate lyase
MFARLKNLKGRDHASSLVERHFVMQAERPAYVREVEIEALAPFLRNLLFTDGTVTRALAAHMLAAISVERIGQSPVSLSAEIADFLEAPPREESIRRQVSIGVGSPAIPILWAESFMVPERLPPGFIGLLDSAPGGIGQSLQRVSLESSRELCWFGLDPVPEWAPTSPPGTEVTLRRVYRIVSDGEPAILISEYFAVEQRAGVYQLAGVLAHDARALEQRSTGD